jgi:hypothetical protein
MLALVLSMGPPGTIPAPSQVSRPALRNRARAQVATPSGGPQDEILAPGPSHISRARRDVTSPCAPRAHARLGAERGPTGHDPGALSDQRALRSACSQLKSSNVPYAPRAVNQRSQTCCTLCVWSMCVSSPRLTYVRSTCVSSPRLTYVRSTCVSSPRLTCASEECVSSQGLTYWLPQAAT